MELKDTIEMMTSPDYKERFKAEYYQLRIRYLKLREMCDKWDMGNLDFTPTCPRYTYHYQLKAMHEYLEVLRTRALMEFIDIPVCQNEKRKED